MKGILTKLQGIDIPRDLKMEEDLDTLILTIQKEGINANMQENASAFEAWALLGKAKGYNKILLKKEKDIEIEKEEHYNRFLYRALCFNKLFEWFILEHDILEEVNIFQEKYLNSEKLIFNVPNNESIVNPANPEAIMEHYFTTNTEITNKLLNINAIQFYSQLPVGTFYEKKSNTTRVFTGGKSAIDFWGITGETLNIIELKAGENKSLGVLSELFFYTCLMRDFYINKLAKPSGESNVRGFDRLINTEIKEICGFILTENIHPQIEIAYEELKKANYIDHKIRFSEKIVQYNSTELN